MMISSFRSDSAEAPCVVALSSALVAGEITSREFYAALRTAQLEDSSKKLFYEMSWSEVEAGDVVLMPWPFSEIVRVEIVDRLRFPGPEGEPLTRIKFEYTCAQYVTTRPADATVYVQSRF